MVWFLSVRTGIRNSLWSRNMSGAEGTTVWWLFGGLGWKRTRRVLWTGLQIHTNLQNEEVVVQLEESCFDPSNVNRLTSAIFYRPSTATLIQRSASDTIELQVGSLQTPCWCVRAVWTHSACIKTCWRVKPTSAAPFSSCYSRMNRMHHSLKQPLGCGDDWDLHPSLTYKFCIFPNQQEPLIKNKAAGSDVSPALALALVAVCDVC